MYPSGGSIWRSIPDYKLKCLLLDEWEVTKLSMRANLPPWQRVSHKSVWDLRLVQPELPLPSITASYHACTTMPPEHIKDKGLYVPLIETSRGFRRICKWEILHSLGMPMNTCLPQDEGDAVSLLGESFPIPHAFKAVLLAVANRPLDKWPQSKIDEVFRTASAQLFPGSVDWDDMHEVEFEGWSILTSSAHACAQYQSLRAVVLHYRKLVIGASILTALQRPKILSTDPPPERSFFHEDVSPDTVQAKIFRPNRGCICVEALLQDQDFSESQVMKSVAQVWNLDEATLLVQRAVEYRGVAFVADEVTTEKVYMRLILLENSPTCALWVKVPVIASDVARQTGFRDWDPHMTINGHPPTRVESDVQDGDLVRLLPGHEAVRTVEKVIVNPLRVWATQHDMMPDQHDVAPTVVSSSEECELPPTQKFRVQLQVCEDVPPQADEAVPCTSSKRKWPDGGLKGGAQMKMPQAFRPGWWIQVQEEAPVQLDLSAVQGRTLRQERERLGLSNVDTPKATVLVFTRHGCLQATWNYKFPFYARDDALLLIRECGRGEKPAFHSNYEGYGYTIADLEIQSSEWSPATSCKAAPVSKPT